MLGEGALSYVLLVIHSGLLQGNLLSQIFYNVMQIACCVVLKNPISCVIFVVVFAQYFMLMILSFCLVH